MYGTTEHDYALSAQLSRARRREFYRGQHRWLTFVECFVAGVIVGLAWAIA